MLQSPLKGSPWFPETERAAASPRHISGAHVTDLLLSEADIVWLRDVLYLPRPYVTRL